MALVAAGQSDDAVHCEKLGRHGGFNTTVLGFQHHLYLLLDQHFTATSVSVRFEGTNVELYEIMLLEFGISIDANGDFTEIATNFVDREGVIHSDPGGGIAYSPSIGDQRDKWEI